MLFLFAKTPQSKGGMHMNTNTLNEQKLNDLAKEVIRFLQKWGLWKDTMIFTCGDRLSYSKDDRDTYEDLCNVRFTENVDPGSYMECPVEASESDEDLTLVWRKLMNPEHIFDMVYEGELYNLLNCDEIDTAALPSETVEELLNATDAIEDFTIMTHEVNGTYEIADQIWEALYDYGQEAEWDPLEFDTWEEYKEMSDFADDEPEHPDYLFLFDNNEEIERAREEGKKYLLTEKEDKINAMWEEMKEEARRFYREHPGALKKYVSADTLKEEFSAIFDRCGLWYEYETCWSLSCYRKE